MISSRISALDLEHLDDSHFIRNSSRKSLRFNAVPVVEINIESSNLEKLAVLSWRWDIDLESNSSRNVYIACQFARRLGIRYLFLDKVTVNQKLNDDEMLIERLEFSKLYQSIPVIAAYDHRDGHEKHTAEVHGSTVSIGHPFSRIIRRPWIAYEVKLYQSNPTKVYYVGHIKNLGCDDNNFEDMVNAIWRSTLCQTVLYTLSGTVSMHNPHELRYIIPEYYDLLTAAHKEMRTKDFFLLAAILIGGREQRINGDQNILNQQFEAFRIGDGYLPDELPKTQDYYTRYDIFLGTENIGWWQTRHKFYPFEELRVWFHVEEKAEQIVRNYFNLPKESSSLKSFPTADPNTDLSGPEMEVFFHEKDLL